MLLGLGTALARAGFLPLEPETGYRLLTGHGISVFFYWLYLGQGTLLLALAATQARPRSLLAFPWLGWLGLILILAGLAASLLGTARGTPLLYDGAPELARTDPAAAFPLYLGYLLLALGLAAVSEGSCLITENIFDGRFQFVQELARMGADIRTDGKHAIVRGRERLTGAAVRATDIRAGAGLVDRRGSAGR